MPVKRTLIIGINTFSYMDPEYQIIGCVYYAKLIKSVLINNFNFTSAKIAVLLMKQMILYTFHSNFTNAVKLRCKDHQPNKNDYQPDRCVFDWGFNLKIVEH